jgi:hypothetical protein
MCIVKITYKINTCCNVCGVSILIHVNGRGILAGSSRYYIHSCFLAKLVNITIVSLAKILKAQAM